MADKILCFRCEKPVQEADDKCPHCGVSRLAPSCPRCGVTVTSARDKRVFYTHHNGFYPWHYKWDNRCAGCGQEFAASISLRTGHTIFFTERRSEALNEMKSGGGSSNPFAGISEITICGSESVYMACDDWDHQPTVEVVVKRAVSANCGEAEQGLIQEARIALTPQEWAAVIDQLQGPLKVLMERQPWSEDTT